MIKKNKNTISKNLPEGIKSYVEAFKIDLKTNFLTDAEIVKKYIIDGEPFNYKNKNELYVELKSKIAEKFFVSVDDIRIVGSAKLGFSIAPDKAWREFCVDSDIDMAIVSERLFDKFWTDLYDFNIYLKARSKRDDITYRRFLDSFFKGWFRPDLFPFHFPGRSDWFKYFQSISFQKYGDKKITCGIFKNHEFFTKYHESNIKRLR